MLGFPSCCPSKCAASCHSPKDTVGSTGTLNAARVKLVLTPEIYWAIPPRLNINLFLLTGAFMCQTRFGLLLWPWNSTSDMQNMRVLYHIIYTVIISVLRWLVLESSHELHNTISCCKQVGDRHHVHSSSSSSSAVCLSTAFIHCHLCKQKKKVLNSR